MAVVDPLHPNGCREKNPEALEFHVDFWRGGGLARSKTPAQAQAPWKRGWVKAPFGVRHMFHRNLLTASDSRAMDVHCMSKGEPSHTKASCRTQLRVP